MKRLNISSPVGQKIASFAAFKEIQSLFKLHPQLAIELVRKYADDRRMDRLQVAQSILLEIQSTFPESMEKAVKILQGERHVNVRCAAWSSVCIEFMHNFNLTPGKLADTIEDHAEMVRGVSTLEVAEFFTENVPTVLEWLFCEIGRILKKNGVVKV